MGTLVRMCHVWEEIERVVVQYVLPWWTWGSNVTLTSLSKHKQSLAGSAEMGSDCQERGGEKKTITMGDLEEIDKFAQLTHRTLAQTERIMAVAFIDVTLRLYKHTPQRKKIEFFLLSSLSFQSDMIIAGLRKEKKEKEKNIFFLTQTILQEC